MLNRLILHNVALIKHLELEFCGALNILSGETGAGKSIIVDGIMLLLGERYDKTVLRFGEEKGYVEGIFESTESSNTILEEFGFAADDDAVIINRTFKSDGKSDIRINGRSATISMLRKLTEVLVDLYGQHEHQSLSKPNEHLRILNYYVRHNTENLLNELEIEYARYLKISKDLKEIGSMSERERTIDMLKFQIDEIEKARIVEGEEDELLQKRKIYIDAEKIAEAISQAREALSFSDEENALQLVETAHSAINEISGISEIYQNLSERLDSVMIELDDIAETLGTQLEETEFSAEDLEQVENRLDKLRSMRRKYGDYAATMSFLDSAKHQLFTLENSSEIYEKLQKEKSMSLKKIYDRSVKLSQIRRNGALEFENLIKSELSDLGMRGADFKVVFEELPTFENCEKFASPNGMDKAEFYLSANAGQPIKPLAKIISGGEMSRFMLALKVISSRLDDIPTMIFDEIDTGISGKIGQEVAKKLAAISRSHQVLCVTHLTQIAAMADNHYLITKSNINGTTETNVELLSEDGIIEEISRLSGSKDISMKAFENAEHIKQWSNQYKNSIKI